MKKTGPWPPGPASKRFDRAGWWVLSNCAKNTSQVHQAAAIEFQLFDGCPPCRRQADHQREIVTPRRVIRPLLPSWVVQRRLLAGSWINGVNIRVFATVAALA
jgi:hypothetical protein